jgi:hypothetical protein
VPQPELPRSKSRAGLLVSILLLLAAVCGVLVYLAFFR